MRYSDRDKFINLNDEVLKNGKIGEINGFKIYRPGKPLFTNLPNEITGAYYKKEYTWKDYGKIAIAIATFIVIVLSLADYLFGAETVTNVLADLITY